MAGDVQVGVRLTGDSSGAVKSLALTRAELDKLGKEMQQAAKRTKDLDAGFAAWAREAFDLKGALAGVTAALAVDRMAEFARSAIDSTAELGRMAEASRVSAEKLQELQFSFQRFDPSASLGDVTEALSTLADRAQDAKDGTQSVVDDFRLIGITADELRNKAPAELISIFAEHVQNTRDPTKRLAAVVRLLGDDLGLKLLPMLSQGADGLKRMADEAHTTGRVLENDLVGVAKEINRQFNSLTQKLDTDFKRTILTTLKDLRELGKALHVIGLSPDERIGQINRRLAVAQEEIAGAPSANSTAAADRLKVMLGIPTKEELRAQFQALREERDRLIREQSQQSARPMTIRVTQPAGVFMTPAQKARTFADFEFSQFEKAPAENLDGGLSTSLPKVSDSISELEDKLKGLQEELNPVKQSFFDLNRLGIDSGRAFGASFDEAINGAKSFGDALKSLAEDLALALTRAIALQAIQTGISAAFPGGGFGASFATSAAASILGARASGGPVTAGGAYLIGERGPELFVPRMSGGIVPNNAIGGTSVVINDNRSTRAPPFEVSQRRGPDGRQLIEITVRETMQKLLDRGDMDGTMARNYGVKRGGRY